MPNDTLTPLPGQNAPATHAAPAIDAEMLQRVVAEAVAPMQKQHQAELESMRNQNEGLQRELQNVRQQFTSATQNAQPDASADELLTTLMADPKGFIASQVGSLIDQRLQSFTDNLVPIVEQVNTGMSSTLVSQHRSAIDAKYGTGTFDEQYKPLLDQRLARESKSGNPLRASDGAWMESEMKAITGHLIDDLIVRREQHTKAVAEGCEKETSDLVSRVTTNLGPGGLGSSFFTAESKDPTPEQQQFLDARERALGSRAKGLPSFEEMRDVSKYKNVDEYREAVEASKNNGSGGLH